MTTNPTANDADAVAVEQHGERYSVSRDDAATVDRAVTETTEADTGATADHAAGVRAALERFGQNVRAGRFREPRRGWRRRKAGR